jgi:hypothetical protein
MFSYIHLHIGKTSGSWILFVCAAPKSQAVCFIEVCDNISKFLFLFGQLSFIQIFKRCIGGVRHRNEDMVTDLNIKEPINKIVVRGQ